MFHNKRFASQMKTTDHAIFPSPATRLFIHDSGHDDFTELTLFAFPAILLLPLERGKEWPINAPNAILRSL